MEFITLLVCRATDLGLLSQVGNYTHIQRLSIYVDDVVVFVKP
jgi:hypothetical protein